MSLILSGTDGLSDVDGTAATPAIRGTDANTGIFFPAADTIAFAEGGAEVARFDSAGNLGLGVTPSAWASGTYKVVQLSGGGAFSGSSGQVNISQNFVGESGGEKYIATAAATSYAQTAGAHRWYNAPSGTAGNAITFTQAMTLDASNNLLLGTTTANANFYVYGAPVSYAGLNATAILSSSASQSTGTGGLLAFEGKYTSAGALANFAAIGGLKENSTDNNYSGYLGFYTRLNGNLAAERARIDSSGNLLVGATSASTVGSSKIYAKTNNGYGIISEQAVTGQYCYTSNALTNGGTFYHFLILENGTQRGSITSNGTATTYGTSSDYRLKENIAPMTGALSTVAQLKPVTYKWKSNGSDGQGFIAHELQAIVPDAVVGEKDAVNEDGSIKPQGIDTSFLVATLTAAIQEQQALITQLTARITALESA